MVFILSSSCQVYNSSTSDVVKYSGDGTPFSNAQIVFATKCTPCHNFHVTLERDLILTGKVFKGDIYASPIITRLRGAGLGGKEDMPPNSQLTQDEIDIIQEWIEE